MVHGDVGASQDFGELQGGNTLVKHLQSKYSARSSTEDV